MGVRIRVEKTSFDALDSAGVKNLVITGKGTRRVALANGELYDRSPVEDLHELNIVKGDIDVFVGVPGSEIPDLDLGGVWKKVVNSVDEVINGNTVVVLEKVEFTRNRGA